MIVDVLTLFPNMFKGPFDESIIKRAQDKSLVEINIHDLRKWGNGKRKTVDDRPYGGGIGMILRVDIIERALQEFKTKNSVRNEKVILLDATGDIFTQKKAVQLTKLDHLILIAGHYEGVDHRVHEHLADEVISIGNYVLTGGEIPAMVLIDTVVRLISGVLEKPQATKLESFSNSNLEYPQYTRPEKFNKWKVPEILLSGDHKKINDWRKNKSLKLTIKIHPDFIKQN